LVNWIVAVAVATLSVSGAIAQPATPQTTPDFKPRVGQPGKDTVWVPTHETLVEKMLDMAKVTPQDFVMDLGSGDGRMVIAAAKRGARAHGVEYNPDMVELSRRNAAAAGVSDRATFSQGDMFVADISKATVLALFLLPDNMRRLREKFFNLPAGSRIVANTFGIEGWEPDVIDRVPEPCTSWCTALLWIVPAKVQGTWRLGGQDLVVTQEYQNIAGTLSGPSGAAAISSGRLNGEEIRFRANGTEYVGRVSGDAMSGTMTAGGTTTAWKATRTAR
jgi:hypothetical protein